MKKINSREVFYDPDSRSPVLVLMDMEKRMAQIKTLMVSLEQEIVALSVELQSAQRCALRQTAHTLQDN